MPSQPESTPRPEYEYCLHAACGTKTVRIWIPVRAEDINRLTNKDRSDLANQITSYMMGKPATYWAVNDFIVARDICNTFAANACQVGDTVYPPIASIYYKEWP